jgi:hypothetical protein
MGFIKHALIGIALYEVGKYILRSSAVLSPISVKDSIVPVSYPEFDIAHNETNLDVGTDPETPLTNPDFSKNEDDPWKNSLANGELRDPDS